MRLTSFLCKQNIARHFRRHWQIQGSKVIIESSAHKGLKEIGIPVVDAVEFVKGKRESYNVEIIGAFERPIPENKDHPQWKDKICHVLPDDKVVVEGFLQAQVLTKTVHISDSLPKHYITSIDENDASADIHNQIQKAILFSNMFDAEQKKLPKIKDPARPAFNFPRILGITDSRRNKLTTFKFLDILEKNSYNLAKERLITDDNESVTTFEKEGDLIQFQSYSDAFVSSIRPLAPIEEDASFTEGIELPNLNPIKFTLSIPKKNMYDLTDIYPIRETAKAFHPHTTFLHFNKTIDGNLHETDVTEEQRKGRSLIHSFTVSSAYAKTIYGENVKILPKPVTIQCVQTDGCQFDFGIFQLNTLDMNGSDGIKNMWYSSPQISLFEVCKYVEGRPTFIGYNPSVYNHLEAFYKNA